MLVIVKSPEAISQTFEPKVEASLHDRSFSQGNRVDHSVAKAHVSDVGLIQANEQYHVIAQGNITAHRTCNSAIDARDVKTDLLQCPVKQTIHLVTPAATMRDHHLLVDAVDVQVNGVLQLNVNVLIRDG